MAAGAERVALPTCPREGHEGWRVWRDGLRGKAPAQRQRLRCVNPDDASEWHRFTLPVLRAAAHEHRCLDCQQLVPTHAGPVVAEGYHYLSKVIAGALVDVAKGRTYSEASQAARKALAHAEGVVAGGATFSAHGQLVADWVEVFSDVVLTQPKRWPQVILLDATDFWRRTGGGGTAHAFTLLFAYGYDAPEGPLPEPDDPWQLPADRATNGRLLRIGLAAKEDEPTWSEFLRHWHGTPLVAVTDGDGGVRNAIKSVWPAGRTTRVRCVYHWRQNLVTGVVSDLARTLQQPGTSAAVKNDEVLALAHKAFASSADFIAFNKAAQERFSGLYKPSSLKWLNTNGGDALAQLDAAAEMPGPQSTGPLEQVINRTRQLVAGRVQGLRNPVRTQRMLNLLAAGLRNDANVDHWADLIYAHLEANARRPARRQRAIAGLTM